MLIKMRPVLALIYLLAAIPIANNLTSTAGLIPVGFGLHATAGTLLIGTVFLYRDVIHRAYGVRVVLAAIALGAVVSFAVAAPSIAWASAAAFAISELADLIVFVPIARRSFVLAVVVSNVAGVLVDTFVFLPLAGFPVTTGIVLGQLVGKLWASALVLPVLR